MDEKDQVAWDQFASAAMPDILKIMWEINPAGKNLEMASVAKKTVELADAMMAEREKRQGRKG